ncbi:MAG: hypothetical protein Q9163_001812 [Psora crenata]
MGKSKKSKAPVKLQAEFVLPEDQPPKRRKKSKNAPDKPHAESPDDQNPVPNARLKTEEQKREKKEEHDVSIDRPEDYSGTATPPSLLLTLVGGFLSSYGFDSASRLYSSELKSRKKKDEIGAQVPKGFPGLVEIFEEWYKEYELKQQGGEETRSNDKGDSVATKSRKDAKDIKVDAETAMEVEQSSSSGESDSCRENSSSTNTTISASTKRKRSASPAPAESAPKRTPKKSNAPFQRVPADTAINPKLASNAYQPYDYAQRAHQDLGKMKGKGFKKEKNKKKQGSYRGGVIDIHGGKGIRFDD